MVKASHLKSIWDIRWEENKGYGGHGKMRTVVNSLQHKVDGNDWPTYSALHIALEANKDYKRWR